MNRNLIKRVIAILLLGALMLSLLPMFAMASESDELISAPIPETDKSGEDNSSIGIIGGADGPTAVFVTGNGTLSTLLLIGGAICALVAVVQILKKRKQ